MASNLRHHGWVRVHYQYLLLLRKSRCCSAGAGHDQGELQLRTDRLQNVENFFVWSFGCRLSGCFSSLFEVIIGLGLLIECSNLTCFSKEKATWFLGGEIDDLCRLLSGVLPESEFEKGKIRRGRSFTN